MWLSGTLKKGVARSVTWKTADGESTLSQIEFLSLKNATSFRKKYVCVEPGYVRGFAKLEPGKTWIGQQVLTVIAEERRLNL